MAYEIGTADNYKDLLNRLRLFITDPTREITSGSGILELDAMPTGEWWATERWDTNFDADNGYELMVNGPGSSGSDEIYVGIQTYYDDTDDEYNWRLFGMTGYVSGQVAENQPGVTAGCWPKMLLWNSSIPYWFLGNGRRFVVIAKVSTVYEMLYLGFSLPYGLPTQFPYPLVVGGSFSGTGVDRYSSITTAHRGFANPYGVSEGVCTGDPNNNSYESSSLKILHGTTWVRFSAFNVSDNIQNVNVVWPFLCADYNLTTAPSHIFRTALRENLDGSYPIFPLIMMMADPQKHIAGELQGCYAVPAFGGIAAEDEFTVNGDTYIAFPVRPNAGRGDFMCIKKE